MKNLNGQLLLALAALVWTSGCASVGPPRPPALELTKPPSDLRAARKGDQVRLTWTIPTLTTDRERVRYLGKTRVCRTLAATMKQCETPAGEAGAPANFSAANKSSAKKVTATFTDTLPAALQQEHAADLATYAVEVQNAAGRSAGISNQVHVALVPTVPPFSGFRAKAIDQGVSISWECSAVSSRARGEIKYLWRIYRREEGNTGETRIAQMEATGCLAGSGDK